ncbi:Na(+)/H(+) antiporter [Pseudomonas phage phiPto-bp6g]|nr:Na(+)/H(+) antiporter [Pseudomonas phage phiPto-bp6g]
MGSVSYFLWVLLMATYFESVNDYRTDQISDSFSSYAFWQKGSITSKNGAASVTQLYAGSFPMPASGNMPIVVFVPNAGVGVMPISQQARNGVFYFNAYGTNVSSNPPRDAMTYYVYLPSNDPAVTVQARGLFTLWNADGRVVFDSDGSYLKVIDAFEQAYNAAPLSKTYGVGKVGVVSCKPQWYVNPASSPGGWQEFAGTVVKCGVDGLPNRVTAGYYPLRWLSTGSQLPNPNDSGNLRRASSMFTLICDVTTLDALPYNIVQ